MSEPKTATLTSVGELLRRYLKTWEGLHGRQLPPDALDAWLEVFRKADYDVLARALEIVTARAERMPVPGMVSKAMDEAHEERAARSAARDNEPKPHISELPAAVRQDMQRMTQDLRHKLGMPEAYEPMTEADAELERQRQKNALAGASEAPWARRATTPLPGPNSPSAATPAPAPPLPGADQEFQATDDDLGPGFFPKEGQ